MKSSSLARKLNLTPENLAAIRQAVGEAELHTTGEIAIAAVPESSNYAFRELLAAVIFGAILFAVCIPFHGLITLLLSRFFWIVPAWAATASAGIISFSGIGLFFLIADSPMLDRCIVPRNERHRAVYNRSIRHIVESGVYATADRTGILIFISWMEREVRILADSGIAAKIDQQTWNSIANKLASGIKSGSTGQSIIEAVGKCAEILSTHFPAKKDNPNELPDGLIILEK